MTLAKKTKNMSEEELVRRVTAPNAETSLSPSGKKRQYPAFEVMIKKVIWFSKHGKGMKELFLSIKKRFDVPRKKLFKRIKVAVKILYKYGYIYKHKACPTGYRLTSKGRQLKRKIPAKKRKMRKRRCRKKTAKTGRK